MRGSDRSGGGARPAVDRLVETGRRLARSRALRVVLGLALLLVFVRWIRISSALENLSLPRPGWLPVVWGLMALSTTLRGCRFYRLGAIVGAPVSLARSVLANWAANLLAVVSPGRVGEGGKVLFFGQKRDLAAVFVLEKLADFGWLLLVGAYGVTLFRQYVGGLAVVAILALGGGVFVFNVERILNWALGRPVFRDQWLASVARRIPAGGWAVFGGSTLLIWALGIATQYLTALAMGFAIPLLLLIRISALTVIAGLVSAIPGGLGVSQFVFTTMLAAHTGVSREVAGLFSLLMLAQTYAVAVALGGPALWLVGRKRGEAGDA